MNATRIQEIREKIETIKEDRSKAKARIEDIEVQWKEEYEVKDLKEAEALLSKMEKEVKTLEGKESDLEEQIEELLEEME